MTCSTLIPEIIKIVDARWLPPCDAPGHVQAVLANPIVGDSRCPMTP
jgi:hypothetical protein